MTDLTRIEGPTVTCTEVHFGDDHDFVAAPVELNPEGYDEYERCGKPASDPIHGAFVRVLRDAETGNVLIAMNPLAVRGLHLVLEAADLKELAQNADCCGLNQEDGDLASRVGYTVQGQLLKLDPYGAY